MVDDAEQLFQLIGNQVVSQIPEKWKKAQIKAEIDDDLSLFDAWYLTAQNEKKMLKISFELSDSFEELRNLGAMSNKNKDKWNICVFILHDDGKFETDFSYS